VLMILTFILELTRPASAGSGHGAPSITAADGILHLGYTDRISGIFQPVLKPHCIRCSHFKVDDVSALEASSKPPVRIVEDNVTASLHALCRDDVRWICWIEYSVALKC
jgi:hypothetical protein